MAEMTTLASGFRLGESVRWHEGRVWFCDWMAGTVITVDPSAGGTGSEPAEGTVVARVSTLPLCIDWLPDGRMLLVAGGEARVLVQEIDGTLHPYADLSALSRHPWNDIVVDAYGRAYVNNIGYAFGVDQPGPGTLAVITPDGSVRTVAEHLLFPNGMIVTPDGSTLVVAESHAGRLTAYDIEEDGDLTNRRVWASLGERAAPDGICLDPAGAIWYADVPNQRCVRVREGGEVAETIDVGLGCFDCVVGGPDLQTLFVVAATWPDAMTPGGDPTGRLLAVPLDR